MLLYLQVKCTVLEMLVWLTQRICICALGKITLVDLAGSERLPRGQTDRRLIRESIEINKSLFALGHVISALANIRCFLYQLFVWFIIPGCFLNLSCCAFHIRSTPAAHMFPSVTPN